MLYRLLKKVYQSSRTFFLSSDRSSHSGTQSSAFKDVDASAREESFPVNTGQINQRTVTSDKSHTLQWSGGVALAKDPRAKASHTMIIALRRISRVSGDIEDDALEPNGYGQQRVAAGLWSR